MAQAKRAFSVDFPGSQASPVATTLLPCSNCFGSGSEPWFACFALAGREHLAIVCANFRDQCFLGVVRDIAK